MWKNKSPFSVQKATYFSPKATYFSPSNIFGPNYFFNFLTKKNYCCIYIIFLSILGVNFMDRYHTILCQACNVLTILKLVKKINPFSTFFGLNAVSSNFHDILFDLISRSLNLFGRPENVDEM